MSQFHGDLRETRGGQKSHSQLERLFTLNPERLHLPADNGMEQRPNTLDVADRDPALLGLPAWSSAFEPQTIRIPPTFTERDWRNTDDTHKARYPAGFAKKSADEEKLWREATRQVKEKKTNTARAGHGSTLPLKPEARRRVTVDSSGLAPSKASSRGTRHEPQRLKWTEGGPYQTRRFDDSPEVNQEGQTTRQEEPNLLSSSPPTYRHAFGRPSNPTPGSAQLGDQDELERRNFGTLRRQTHTGHDLGLKGNVGKDDMGDDGRPVNVSGMIGMPVVQGSRGPYEDFKVLREPGFDAAAENVPVPVTSGSLPGRQTADVVFQRIDIDIHESSSSSEVRLEPSLKNTASQGVGKGDIKPLVEGSDGPIITKELTAQVESGKESTVFWAKPSLPSGEDSFKSISDSLGTLLEATGNPFAETDNWFRNLERRTQPLLREHRRTNMKSRVKIAILDTGIDLRHNVFKDHYQVPNGRVKKVEDFVQIAGTGADVQGHGTYCAALLRKVAPEADIYVARVAVGKGVKSELRPANVVQALNRACRTGKDEEGIENWDVDIVSMSLGFYKEYEILSQAVRDAFARNKIIVAAVSNDGDTGPCMWPASLTGVFAIHPARGYGETSATAPLPVVGNDFSILGENVESAWICGTDEDGSPVNTARKERRSGASVATPIAAGVIALVLELAMQGDLGNPDCHAMFTAMLPKLKSFDGIREILFSMSRRRDHLNLNIVPWVLLDAKLDSNPDLTKRASRSHLAIIMKFILKQRFG